MRLQHNHNEEDGLHLDSQGKDTFDRFAKHYIAMDNERPIGTCRVISLLDAPDNLPIQEHPGLHVPLSLSKGDVEVCRFLTKSPYPEHILLGFLCSMLQDAALARTRNVFLLVSMELYDALRRMKLSVTRLGEPAVYGGGFTVPVKLSLDRMIFLSRDFVCGGALQPTGT
jgi:N-acyl-L-homoserine lactone synthetase